MVDDPNVVTYYNNLEFVLTVASCHEYVVIPKESTTFGTKWTTECKLKDFKNTPFYKANKMGLRDLQEKGKSQIILANS